MSDLQSIKEAEMKDRFTLSVPLTLSAVLVCSVLVTACARKVEGATYSGDGGVRVEFKSGGKAYVSSGLGSMPCTYTESGGTVTLGCEGDKTVFTMDNDGALNGPQGGLLARLTKQK